MIALADIADDYGVVKYERPTLDSLVEKTRIPMRTLQSYIQKAVELGELVVDRGAPPGVAAVSRVRYQIALPGLKQVPANLAPTCDLPAAEVPANLAPTEAQVGAAPAPTSAQVGANLAPEMVPISHVAAPETVLIKDQLKRPLELRPKSFVPSAPAEAAPDGFEDFWLSYPTRNGKKLEKAKTRAIWNGLSATARASASAGVAHYADACNSGVTLAKDPARWLRGRCWEDWQEPAVRSLNGRTGSPEEQIREARAGLDELDRQAGWR